MADEKDLPLRAAEVPQGAVQAASCTAESAAPEVADGDAVPTAGAQDEAVERFSRIKVKIPASFGVTAEDFSRVLQALAAACRTEKPETIGAVFWAVAEGWPEVNAAIYAMEMHNRPPISLEETLNRTFAPAAAPEKHDPRTCQHPECKSKRGQA